MSRVATKRIVARVHHMKTVSNRPVSVLIGDSVGSNATLSGPHIQDSIACLEFGASPIPARISAAGFIDVSPESDRQRGSWLAVVPAST
jgi:hypothetical protein